MPGDEETLSLAVRTFRKKFLGLTQEEFGREFGLSITAVSRYENKGSPHKTVLEKLAKRAAELGAHEFELTFMKEVARKLPGNAKGPGRPPKVRSSGESDPSTMPTAGIPLQQMGRFTREDLKQIEQVIREIVESTPAGPQQLSWAEQLEQLGKLRDKGLLTAEEFEAKKKQILGI